MPLTEAIEIKYMSTREIRRWDKNPKKHDLEALIRSIKKYGYRDAVIFDSTLNAVVAGNGRAEALERMRTRGEAVPRGIRAEGNDWLMPVQVGIDAASVAEAIAFAVDHNNLTILGGDFTNIDMAELWDPKAYIELLEQNQGVLPVSVTSADLPQLRAHYEPPPKENGNGAGEESPSEEPAQEPAPNAVADRIAAA